MRVCVDARMIFSSGIGTIIQNFLLRFSGEFSLIAIGDKTLIESFLTGKINYEILHCEIPIYSLKEQLLLPKLIPVCDIFWSPHYNIPLLPIKAKKRVVNVNDVFHLANSHTIRWHQWLYAKLVINQAVTKSDRVITISEFSKAEIIKYTKLPKLSKIELIYCGVDHGLFKVITKGEALNKIRVKYNLPTKYILFVGNIKPHKNLKVLVNALALLKDKMGGCKLVIVGKKDGFINGDPLLFDQISKDQFLKDSIYFTGFVPNEDLPFLYNLASLFVFPSRYEGFGLPPLEAMACGCLVLVSNAASIPEICGNSARYFDPSSPEDLANKIAECFSDKKNELYIRKGLDHSKSFSWEESYRKQLTLFHNVINNIS